MFKPTLRSLILMILYLTNVWCANLLLIFSFPSKSMHLSAFIMAEILTQKGHIVTTVTPYENGSSKKHFRHIVLREVMNQFNDDGGNFVELNNVNPFSESYTYYSMGISLSNATFRDKNFQHLLKENNEFDLIILETIFCESLTYISEYMKIPLLLYTSLDASVLSNAFMGNPSPPSYIPNLVSKYTSEMTFFERLDNALLHITGEMIRNFVSLPAHDAIVKTYFPGAPDIHEYYNRASVMLLNGDTSVSDAVPKVPGMIDIGGFHIKSPGPLPEHLREILNKAQHGVIYFGLGSNVKSKDIPDHIVKGFLRVFSELKEVVLWKWDGVDLPGKSPNVFFQEWFPQNDILAHENVKLFVTHAGFHSILEAVYHGVPCLALPIFADQVKNARRATKVGYAEFIKFEDLTVEEFQSTLNKLLSDSRYKEVATERSMIMRDKPMSNADKLAFWVDYVIRHKGANHLKFASLNLNWYQYLLLDVVAFILCCFVIFVTALRYIFKKSINIHWKNR